MGIIFADGGKGTATLEAGRHGGGVQVLHLRRGYPVAAQSVGGLPVAHVSAAILASLGLSSESVADVLAMVGE